MPTVWPSKASFLPFHLDQQHEMLRVYLVAGVLALEISASAMGHTNNTTDTRAHKVGGFILFALYSCPQAQTAFIVHVYEQKGES